jgi:hypothetical protein
MAANSSKDALRFAAGLEESRDDADSGSVQSAAMSAETTNRKLRDPSCMCRRGDRPDRVPRRRLFHAAPRE